MGEELAGRIQALVPVLPVALLSRVLLQVGEAGIPELQLKRDALALAEKLKCSGVTVALDKNDEERSFSEGLYLLLKRRHAILGGDRRLRCAAGAGALLDYYSNGIPEAAAGAVS